MENNNVVFEQEKNVENLDDQNEVITKKDVNRLFFRWYVLCEMSNSFERLQSIAFCASIAPALKKLYKDKERLADALQGICSFSILKESLVR